VWSWSVSVWQWRLLVKHSGTANFRHGCNWSRTLLLLALSSNPMTVTFLSRTFVDPNHQQMLVLLMRYTTPQKLRKNSSTSSWIISIIRRLPLSCNGTFKIKFPYTHRDLGHHSPPQAKQAPTAVTNFNFSTKFHQIRYPAGRQTQRHKHTNRRSENLTTVDHGEGNS